MLAEALIRRYSALKTLTEATTGLRLTGFLSTAVSQVEAGMQERARAGRMYRAIGGTTGIAPLQAVTTGAQAAWGLWNQSPNNALIIDDISFFLLSGTAIWGGAVMAIVSPITATIPAAATGSGGSHPARRARGMAAHLRTRTRPDRQAQRGGDQLGAIAVKRRGAQKSTRLIQRKGRQVDALEEEEVGPHMTDIERLRGAREQPYRLADEQIAHEVRHARRHTRDIVEHDRPADLGQPPRETMHARREFEVSPVEPGGRLQRREQLTKAIAAWREQHRMGAHQFSDEQAFPDSRRTGQQYVSARAIKRFEAVQ